MTYTPDDLNADVKTYLDLDDKVKDLQARQADIKARMRDNLAIGKHETDLGVHVTVSAPSRRFNLARAVDLLQPELREQCKADGYDASKVKRFLPPALLDVAMDAGTGDPVVRIQ
jgi:hypothetical protein